MPTEETIRAYLLGLADPETERTVEEGILDGSLDTNDLLVVEEELVDDHVFGRLAPEEEAAFQAGFLINRERTGKVLFSRAMQKYARKHKAASRPRFSLFGFPRLALAGGVSLFCLLAISLVLVGIRNARLSHELASLSRASDERQRLLDELTEERRQRSSQVESAIRVPGEVAVSIPAHPAGMPSIRLRPGVKRGLEPLPVLHLAAQEPTVRITLELAFQPEDGIREDLVRTGGERIWTQELTPAGPTVMNGTTTLYVPSELLLPGEYQIRLRELSGGSDEGDVYGFRVTGQ